jgi:hypothetical protein
VAKSLYALAQNLDERQFRKLGLENIAINSKAIGQVKNQSAEFSIPILNTWYNISSSARDLHRNSLSTIEISTIKWRAALYFGKATSIPSGHSCFFSELRHPGPHGAIDERREGFLHQAPTKRAGIFGRPKFLMRILPPRTCLRGSPAPPPGSVKRCL